uniref:Interleukin-6 receptor subunit alpha isoform X2 n=1 Tax=Pogona vitticeps TaxID=103695 RepID=A0ABM5F4N0_9SAUR
MFLPPHTLPRGNASGHRIQESGHRLGIMQLLRASLMARLVAAVVAWVADPGHLCLPPAASSSNVMVGQLGRNVTLPCLEGEAENTTLTQWRFEGRNLDFYPAAPLIVGTNLFLPMLHFNHSGFYSCHAGKKLLRTWCLVLEEPLESPDFTCRRKSLLKDILCEWKMPRPMSVCTKARLWMQKVSPRENPTEQQCRYYGKSRKVTCRIVGLHHEEDIFLLVTACVVNPVGASNKTKYLWINSLLKPDPPADVTVYPVEKASRKLRVTWRYPYSWGTTFYHLQFELRYWVETSQMYSEVQLRPGVTSYVISDALEGLRHIVRVRCREEYNHGAWSEWSRESSGIPWTEPKDPEPELMSYFPEFPYYFINTEKPTTPEISKELDIQQEVPTLASLHLVLMVVISVTVGFTLIALIIFWCRKRWGPPSYREGKPSTAPTYALAPLSPEPPLSASPLLSPPASPFSESSVDSPRVLDNGPYDVANADYFLLPK